MFDDTEIAETPFGQTFTVDKKIKVLIDQLDFRYGAIAFSYRVSEIKTEVEFEIENEEVRPEFDVLKPYFSKVLKSKYVEAEVFAEFENNLLVSQKASSTSLESINREIIESVKFRFIEQGILGKQYVPGMEENFQQHRPFQLSQTLSKILDICLLVDDDFKRRFGIKGCSGFNTQPGAAIPIFK